MSKTLRLRGGHIWFGTGQTEKTDLIIRDGIVASAAVPESGDTVHIDAGGHLVYPGLINAHDHLVGTWSPKAGDTGYENVYQWLDEYNDGPIRQERKGAPADLVIRLGAYRNILSGVTTVVDHYLRTDGSEYAGMPLRVIFDFGREWVLRSHTDPAAFPPWGKGISAELEQTGGEVPFIIHLAEGLDEEARGELTRLSNMGALRHNTVIVHGVALTHGDIEKIAAAGAKVIWCPNSNHYLYGETADIRALLDAGVTVALGTDSTVTGSGYLLEEMRYARKAYLEKYARDLPPSAIADMVTGRAADALMLAGKAGTLTPGAWGDVLLVEDTATDPAEVLLSTEPRHIDLVLVGGVPVVGSTRHEALFEALQPDHCRASVQGREKLVAGDVHATLTGLRQAVGSDKHFHFLPLDGA